MRRKLVQQGESTLMISLPKNWLVKNSLQKGDEVSIDLQNNVLVVSSDGSASVKQVKKITLTNESETNLRTMITVLYRKGVDEIEIAYTSKRQLAIVENVILNKLLGFEITRKSAGVLIVEAVAEPAYDKFESIFQKVFYSANELFDEVILAYENKTQSSDVEAIVSRIQRYDNFCRRAIAKNTLADKKTDFLWGFLSIYVHALRELHFLNSLDAKLRSTRVVELIRGAKEMSQLLQKAILQEDISHLDEVHAMEKVLIYANSYAQFTSAKNTVSVYHATSLVRQLYLCCSNLLGCLI